MATDVETLMLRLEASAAQLERETKRANQVFDRNMRAMERRAQSASKGIEAQFGSIGSAVVRGLGGIGGRILAATAGIMAAGKIVQAADAWTGLGNRLRGAGVEGATVARIQEDLVDVALRSRTAVTDVVGTFSDLKIATKELGLSDQELLGITETLSKAFLLGGKSAAEAAGAMTQLGQGLSAGALRGDELNSVLEGAPLVAQAIAREFGVTTGELKKLGEAGELASNRIVAALSNAGPEIERQFGQTIPTVEQATRNLNTAFTQLIGVMNESGGASRTYAELLLVLAGALDTVAASARSAQAATRAAVLEAPAALQSNIAALEAKIASGELRGVDLKIYQDRLAIEQARLKAAEGARAAAEAEGQSIRETNRAKGLTGLEGPFSYTPFEGPGAPRGKPDGLLLSARERGIGVAQKVSDYDREVRSIEEKTAALVAEAKAVGLSTFEQEKAKAVQDLLTAAKRDGTAATAEEKAKIDALATSYANAKVAVEQAEKAQRELIASLDAVRSTAGSTLGTFANDLADGVTAAEALQTAITSIRTAIINAFSNQLVAALLGPTGTAGGGIFSGLFGRAAGGPVNAGQAYPVGETGPEIFVPRSAGRIIPAGGAGGSSVTYAPVIDARGADPAAAARIERTLAAHSKQIETIVKAPNRQRRGMAA